MTDIVVRRAAERDLEAIVGLWREMAELHAEIEPAVWTLGPEADEHYRRHLSECMSNADYRVFVAARGEDIVGFLLASKGKRPPVLSPPVQGAIHDTCVTQSARRRGVGKQLVGEAMGWFRSEGLPLATVSYALGNRVSGAFWRAQGFRPYQAACVRPVAEGERRPGTTFDNGGAYFASVAETYDRLQPVVAGPSYDLGLAMVADLVPHEPGDAFAFTELGCGTASLTRMVLDRFSRATATAIDGELAMIEVARRKLAAYADRAQVREADVLSCDLPACDVVLSSFMFHHLPPERLEAMFGRIARALRPGGCLLLLDQMTAGPVSGERVRAQSRRLYQRHVGDAVAAGRTTQAEIDARWAFKRKMKEEGKDVEYRHSAAELTQAMQAAGFSEVGFLWRLFATTILVAFVAGENE